MIEITVDLALLTIDPSANDRLEGWELSARFKSASQLLESAKSGIRLEMPLGPPSDFVERHQAEVKYIRTRYWKGKHPTTRWTNNRLADDIKCVDTRFPALSLRRTYEELYRYACWGVHGGGLAAVRGRSALDMAFPCTLAFYESAQLGWASAEFASRLLNRFDVGHQQALKSAREDWVLAFGSLRRNGVRIAAVE